MAMDVATAVEYLVRSRKRGRLGHAYLVSGGDVAQRASLGLMVLRELAGISAGSLEQAEGSRAVIVSPGSASRRIVVDQIRKQVEPRLQAASGGQLKVAELEPDRVHVIDASLSKEQVGEMVWARVQELIACDRGQ